MGKKKDRLSEKEAMKRNWRAWKLLWDRCPQMRMYSQQENVSSAYKEQDHTFSSDGEIARCARGPMGLWAALSQSIAVVLTCTVYLYVCLKARGGAFGIGSVTQYVGAVTNTFLGISACIQILGELRVNAEFLETNFEFLDIPNRMYQGEPDDGETVGPEV